MDSTIRNIKFRIEELLKFNNALMSNAPKGYQPHYFLIQKDGKVPDGKEIFKRSKKNASWKQEHARLDIIHALSWIEKGGNIGIAGTDGLINIDIDDEKYIDLLKPTLTAISRSRTGRHGFYWKHPDEKILPLNIPTDYGEVRADWQYVLAPGSYVPCPECKDELSGYYTIDEEQSPSFIKFDELPLFFKEQYKKNIDANKKKAEIKKEPIIYDGKQSTLFKLRIENIVTTTPGIREAHPLHDSDTGQNFSVSGSLSHCWRHLVSLNALQFLVVKSGYMSCQDAGTPHKGGASKIDDGAIFYAWVEAKKCNLIPKLDPIPTRALKYIARKHKLISKDEFVDGLLPLDMFNKVIKILKEEY